MNVQRISGLASLVVTAWLDSAWLCACLSRMLLLLVGIEIVTMPITQHLWKWDHFLHGGHDFEMTLLVTVTCFCLMLLLAHNSRQSRIASVSVSGSQIPSCRDASASGRPVQRPSSATPFCAHPSTLRSLPLLI